MAMKYIEERGWRSTDLHRREIMAAHRAGGEDAQIPEVRRGVQGRNYLSGDWLVSWHKPASHRLRYRPATSRSLLWRCYPDLLACSLQWHSSGSMSTATSKPNMIV